MTAGAGEPLNRFETAYQGEAPWDIGRPQPVVERLAAEGLLSGDVLDVGCGTGENALFLARAGARVLGVDFVVAAIERARDKARARGVAAAFEVRDALRLSDLGRTFDAVLDCGLFHTFEDRERPAYVDGLRAVLRVGGAVHVVCFSEEETSEGGPRRVSQAEIRAAFADGFLVEWVRPARMSTRVHPDGARVWLARAVRGSRP